MQVIKGCTHAGAFSQERKRIYYARLNNSEKSCKPVLPQRNRYTMSTVMEHDINTIRVLFSNHAVKWTAHALARLQERGITPDDVRHCVMTGIIIEQYPNDYPYPSCLVSGCSTAGSPLHAVIGTGQGFAWLITAYYPDPDKWNTDFSLRRETD